MVASAMQVPIVMVTFEVIGEYDVSTPVMFTDELVGKSLADAWGNTLATRFDDQTTLVLVREKDQTSPR